MAKQVRNLFCTLTELFVTSKGELIPKGAPVRVIEWDNEKGQVTVQVQAFMPDKRAKKVAETLVVKLAPNMLSFDQFDTYNAEG